MAFEIAIPDDDFDPRFKIFHELMNKKVREILLISTPYDAWIMEEDCRLSERIINEYRGLNLSHPPRLNWVSSAAEALASLDQKQFDMVITMSGVADLDAFTIGKKIKKKAPDLPVVLLSHQIVPSEECYPEQSLLSPIDRTFVWSGNTDILLAIIKSAEDRMNVFHDTNFAGIRVIIFVEDSPAYISSLLPILYKELVTQAQEVMEEGLNEEHRLLAMRARPKILVAQSYEEAINLFEQFEPYVLALISDVRFPRQCVLDVNAGVNLLEKIKKIRFDIPLLLTSSEPNNAEKAASIPAIFVDKSSPSLHAEVKSFFLNHLGFGDFVFRMPDRRPITRASNLLSLEKNLYTIPEESFVYHCNRNDFSRWLFARSEIELASRVRPIRDDNFTSIESHRQYLISIIRTRRMRRQKGVVVNFDAGAFDLDTDFFKIGTGSLGGKGRGLAFISSFLQHNLPIHRKFDPVDISVPQTLALTTEGFDQFVENNDLKAISKYEMADVRVAEHFLKGQFPSWLEEDLKAYLSQIKYPLAVRSSSLLEDAQFRAYAGLYKTYMLPNDDPHFERRLNQLVNAIKLVYASTYFQGPKAFSKRVGHRTEEEKMAVIIQRMVGESYGNFFYPAISGLAQSHNFYPFSKMKPEEGIATIALGLGKTVMEGEKALRFSPQYPELLPQRAAVEDILENSQRFFYALKLGSPDFQLGINESVTLKKREVSDAVNEPLIKLLTSTYIPDEHRIRDTDQIPGYPVLTFSSVLKYNSFPLADILKEMLELGQQGIGCPIELEFSVNLSQKKECNPEFAILQIRPMTAREELMKVVIDDEDIKQAFCFSSNALGNVVKKDMEDILYVKPDEFDPGRTPEIAQEIGKMNAMLQQEGRQYLLIGPGRWGSADRWLGIPANWSEICGVGAIVETAHPQLKAEPSQGSHFFHNITTLGINYITVLENKRDFIDWNWLTFLPTTTESNFIAHVRLDKPLTLKVDGRKSQSVVYSPK
jgi:DNA-binding NarL/FixJ family response regulator